MKTIPYGHQFIDRHDIKAITSALKSDYLTQGPLIERFEKDLSTKVGSKYAVVFNSGTAALHAAYFAAGLSQHDEIITSSITFAATANAALYLGALPVFCDISIETGNINPDLIEKLITKKTKIIVPVHYGGLPADLIKIQKIAHKYKLAVVEDASHALGAKYYSKNIGNCKYSDMCTFSFHPVKHITTGEGGAVTTNNFSYYQKLITFRTHGIVKNKKLLINRKVGAWYHEMQTLGYNYRLTDIQAALGISQLKKLDKFIKIRQQIAGFYNREFKSSPYFDILQTNEYLKSANHLYPILLKDKFINIRKKLFDKLRDKHIGVQVHYIPVYWHPYYQKLGYKRKECMHAENFYQKEISLPIYPGLTQKQLQYIVKTLMTIFKSIT